MQQNLTNVVNELYTKSKKVIGYGLLASTLAFGGCNLFGPNPIDLSVIANDKEAKDTYLLQPTDMLEVYVRAKSEYDGTATLTYNGTEIPLTDTNDSWVFEATTMLDAPPTGETYEVVVSAEAVYSSHRPEKKFTITSIDESPTILLDSNVTDFLNTKEGSPVTLDIKDYTGQYYLRTEEWNGTDFDLISDYTEITDSETLMVPADSYRKYSLVSKNDNSEYTDKFHIVSTDVTTPKAPGSYVYKTDGSETFALDHGPKDWLFEWKIELYAGGNLERIITSGDSSTVAIAQEGDYTARYYVNGQSNYFDFGISGENISPATPVVLEAPGWVAGTSPVSQTQGNDLVYRVELDDTNLDALDFMFSLDPSWDYQMTTNPGVPNEGDVYIVQDPDTNGNSYLYEVRMNTQNRSGLYDLQLYSNETDSGIQSPLKTYDIEINP